ncbi:hypothetical protein Pst134EA_013504 [Puccinia striiformis f. sp. tritici]|uniref:hypothetical protein n=1 Tax=Puccinia striiformis f. sp. tritici TaxID=168172 RepID=UPI0020076906|nr:hypothetical protein Pst134EA_013504 [Puccinia striiformis f. sp. tritici]KAH9465622.1 hypothetical protein Pst134EA_013504 [Puccinia striiformis f. sp. tritici]
MFFPPLFAGAVSADGSAMLGSVKGSLPALGWVEKNAKASSSSSSIFTSSLFYPILIGPGWLAVAAAFFSSPIRTPPIHEETKTTS